jgi:O-antigen ligase
MKQKKTITETAKKKITIFDSLFFLLIGLLPFIYSESIVDPVLISRQLFLTVFEIILLSIIAYRILINKIKFDFSFLKNKIFIVFLAFIGVGIVSTNFSILDSESFYVLSKYSVELVFLLITVFLLVNQILNFDTILKAIIVFTIIVILMIVKQLLELNSEELPFREFLYRINATMGHKNLLSSILFLTLPFLIISGIKFKSIRVLVIGVILSNLLFIWFLQTRAVFLSLAVCIVMLLIGWVIFYFKQKDLFNLKKFVLVVITSFSLFAVLTFSNIDRFKGFFNSDSASERASIWGNSLKMVKEHPILGVGSGNWQLNIPSYGLSNYDNWLVRRSLTTFQRPHNDFLWVLCESGIIGLIFYLSIFIFAFYYLIKIIKNNFLESINALILLIFLIGYMIIAFFDFPLERIEHQLFLMLMLSLVIVDYHKNKVVEKSLPIRYVYMFFAIALVPISLLITVKRYQGEKLTRNLFDSHYHADWKSVIYYGEEAKNDFYKIDATSMPIDWFIGVAYFSLNDFENAKIYFGKAHLLNPNNIHVLNNWGSCFEKLGDHKNAISKYKEVIKLSSTFDESILNLAAVYFNIKDYDKAFKTIDTCPTHSTDSKYRLFLPPILKKKLYEILLKCKSEECRLKIEELKKSDEKLIDLFLKSKKQKISFERFVML